MGVLDDMRIERALLEGAIANRIGRPRQAPSDIGIFAPNWLAGWERAAAAAAAPPAANAASVSAARHGG